jgi:hypothetical protein
MGMLIAVVFPLLHHWRTAGMQISQSPDLAEYFGLAAGVLSPWRANQYNVDDASKTIHVWVTSQAAPVEQKRGWFGAKAAPTALRQTGVVDQRWRHLNCMDYLCFIHTHDQLEASHRDLPWFGQADMPFSNRLARKIFLFLMEGLDMQVICDVLKVSFTDLWKFKYALDNGLLNFEYAPATHRKPKDADASMAPGAAANSKSSLSSESQSTGESSSKVPDMSDPVWEELITGALNIQIKTLSFQFLLTKLRQQVSLQQSADVKLMKLRELHRYVERHERVLSHELSQLKQ